MFETTRARTTRRAAIVAAVAAGIVLLAPTAAHAHVGVMPDAIDAGGSAVLTFSFTHGCENSPTTALRITMPEGLASVAPTLDSNWDIAVERADDGLVSAVTYTALSPIPGELRGAASMAVQLMPEAPESLAFPVEQQCESGVNEWVEIADAGVDPHDLDAPAPVVTVTSGEAAAEAPTEAPAESPLPIAFGIGGLVAALAALTVAVLAYRRSA